MCLLDLVGVVHRFRGEIYVHETRSAIAMFGNNKLGVVNSAFL